MPGKRDLAGKRDLIAFRPFPPDPVTVPDFDGLIVRAVLQRAQQAGVMVSITSQPAPIEQLLESGRWQVAAQHPPAGAERYRGDSVVVDLRRDDGEAGDREPRTPPPRVARGRERGDVAPPDTAIGQGQSVIQPDPR